LHWNTHRFATPALYLALTIVVLWASVIAACGSGEPEPTPNASATAPTTSTAAGTPGTAPPGSSMRGLDFTQPPYAAELTQRAGGGDVSAERVRYIDLSGDGVEEAVVIVESGGTLGDIGVGIYQAGGTGPRLVYFRKLVGHVDIRNGIVVMIEGAPAPGDPECCPSQLRESSIEWRNSAFEVTSERVVPGQAGSPEPGY
jgi:hypothetical protein